MNIENRILFDGICCKSQTDGKEEKPLDVTYLVLYALIINKECRGAIVDLTGSNGEYLVYYEESKYQSSSFLSAIPAEYVPCLKRLIGLLEKVRKEREDQETYRFFMKIVYAGYEKIWQEIKNSECVSGSMLMEAFREEFAGTDMNMMPIIGKALLFLIVAEDMKVSYVWDEQMCVLIPFIESFTKELEYGMEFVADGQEQSMDYEDFLKRFDEKYDTHNSLLNLAIKPLDEQTGDVMCAIMKLYQINPRKFWEYALSEGEVKKILEQSPKWTMKQYWNMLIVAQLCKYIQKLEQAYLDVFLEQSSDIQDDIIKMEGKTENLSIDFLKRLANEMDMELKIEFVKK